MIDCYTPRSGRMEGTHFVAAVVDNELFLWGGNVYQDGRLHNSPEKCQFYSSVEVFNVKTGYWEQRSGTPPSGGLLLCCCQESVLFRWLVWSPAPQQCS